MDASLFLSNEQAGFLEDAQMLGDGRKGHVERLRQLADGPASQGHASEDGAAGRIGEGGEGAVDGRWILNH